MIDAVPGGLGGNVGPAPMPVYGLCGVEYDRSQAQETDRRLAHDAREQAERNERLSQTQRIERDPQTPVRIAELAAELIQHHPGETRPVIVDVEISPRIPGLPTRHGRAEVYRVWPVGMFDYVWKDGTFQGAWGVTTTGAMVLISEPLRSGKPEPATTVLSPRMRWYDPVEKWHPTSHQWRVHVLRRLEADRSRLLGTAPTEAPAPTVVGRPLTNRQIRRLDKVRMRRFQTGVRLHDLEQLVGTPDRPAVRGRPNRHDRKRLREMHRLRANMDRFEVIEQQITGRSSVATSRADEGEERE